MLLALLLATLSSPTPAHADVAPPEWAPGVDIAPGTEQTQVRMVSEQVTLTIIPAKNEESKDTARTEAIFHMRNEGAVEEKMAARFPLIFGPDTGFYYSWFPESTKIQDILVSVDGNIVPTRETKETSLNDGYDNTPIPWANFWVTFPPGQEVTITVSYTATGFGYEPFTSFRYILETGAGWKDTIGTADIIIKLPYPASEENVLFDGLWMDTTPSASFVGNEVRWQFKDLEPTPQDNIGITMVGTYYWNKVLRERELTAKNPKDGEAWGRLGKAIKEAMRDNKGFLRYNEAGKVLYAEAAEAYEKAVTILPQDALWHYGYADLLLSYHRTFDHLDEHAALTELSKAVEQLNRTLELDPDNPDVKKVSEHLGDWVPVEIIQSESSYRFVVLVSTQNIPATETIQPTKPPQATATLLPSPRPSSTIQPTKTDLPPQTPTPTPVIPICGGVALILPLTGWVTAKRK